MPQLDLTQFYYFISLLIPLLLFSYIFYLLNNKLYLSILLIIISNLNKETNKYTFKILNINSKKFKFDYESNFN